MMAKHELLEIYNVFTFYDEHFKDTSALFVNCCFSVSLQIITIYTKKLYLESSKIRCYTFDCIHFCKNEVDTLLKCLLPFWRMTVLKIYCAVIPGEIAKVLAQERHL